MRQLFQYHPTIGYHFVPGLVVRVLHENGGYLIRVNGLGFRSNREYAAPRTAGLRRILLFGDSFTAGDGVPNEERFGDLLESAIPDLEVYNFGLPGSGPDQQYLACKEFCGAIEHDLLVIAVHVDNVRRVKSSYKPYLDESGVFSAYGKPYYVLADGRLSLCNVPVPLASGQGGLSPAMSEMLRRVKDLGRQAPLVKPVPEYDDPQDASWCVMRAILESWIREHTKPVLLIPLPLFQFVEEDCDSSGYIERFREVCAATGSRFHDPLPDLRGYSRDERRAFRFERDIHPTPAGHKALADSLLPAVSDALVAD